MREARRREGRRGRLSERKEGEGGVSRDYLRERRPGNFKDFEKWINALGAPPFMEEALKKEF